MEVPSEITFKYLIEMCHRFNTKEPRSHKNKNSETQQIKKKLSRVQ